jgi:excisionase family DNA binding protein
VRQPLLTVDDVALQLRVSRVTAWRRMRSGELACIRDGGVLRCTQAHVDAYIASHTQPAKPVQAPARAKH